MEKINVLDKEIIFTDSMMKIIFALQILLNTKMLELMILSKIGLETVTLLNF